MPPARAVFCSEARYAAYACLTLGVGAVAALALPLPFAAWSVLALGAPHLLSDIRHLVLKTGYGRRAASLWPAALLLAVAGLGYGVAFGVAAAGAAVLFSRGPGWRRGIGVVLASALGAAAFSSPRLATLLFVYLHNVVALVVWAAWRPRKTAWHLLAPAFCVLFCVAVAAGIFDPVNAWLGGRLDVWHDARYVALAESLAPGVAEPWRARLLAGFAFALFVHYAVWLDWLPRESGAPGGILPFAEAWRNLASEVGRPAVFVTAAVTLLFCAAGLADWPASRAAYLKLAAFHGSLELAALGLFFAEGRPRAILA